MNVRLTKDQKIRILNSDDIYTVMQQILLRENRIRRNQEHFWVVGLNNSNKILFIELLGLGTVNRVNANPPEIFRMAIYKLAVKIILVHNHPSGNLKPSKEDIHFTDRILKVGKIVNIEVIDHLIITDEDYTSFENEGHLDEIKKSGMYEVVDRQKINKLDWKLDIERQNGEKAKAIKIAKKMKSEGMDEKLIKKMTGLYIDEVRRL